MSRIVFDEAKGKRQALRWVDEVLQVMGGSEGLTALQELILDGDINTAMYQIDRLKDLDEEFDTDEDEPISSKKHKSESGRLPMAQSERSILHYAALTSQEEMCRRLMEETPFLSQINEGEIVTGFSPLHFASWVQNPSLFFSLLAHGADIDFTDSYGCTVVDYLRFQGKVPSQRPERSVSVMFIDQPSEETPSPILTQLSPEEFIRRTSLWKPAGAPSRGTLTWTSQYKINDDYIEELMFGGYEPPTVKDTEFRAKYFESLESNLGESGVVIAWINNEVGWGCYAAKNFKKGEFIVAYLGQFVSKKVQKDRSYSMASSIDGIILDASTHRNLAAYINHSATPNAEAQGVFHKGVDRIIISALQPISIGQQICLNYGEDYFRVKSKTTPKTTAQTTKTSASPAPAPASAFQDMLTSAGQMPSMLPESVIEQIKAMLQKQ